MQFAHYSAFQTGDVIPMPVPSSYNDITQDRDLRDFIGWVWYDKEVYIPKAWNSDDTRVVLRFESAHYNTIVVSFVMFFDYQILSTAGDISPAWLFEQEVKISFNSGLQKWCIPHLVVNKRNETSLSLFFWVHYA